MPKIDSVGAPVTAMSIITLIIVAYNGHVMAMMGIAVLVGLCLGAMWIDIRS